MIGIGAGPSTDGQVLVLHDLLKVHDGPRAEVRRASSPTSHAEMLRGVEAYAEAVRSRAFPAPEHTYSIPPEELERLRARAPRRSAPAYDW